MIAALVLASCAPRVDGPLERQQITDRADAERLAAQLTALPGALDARVTLRRPVADPLGTQPAAAATAALLVIVDDRADRAAIAEAARALAGAIAPEIERPTVLVEVGAVRPELAKVGPFTVEASSRGPLRASLAIALALIAGLAGWIAWLYRRGSSAQ